MSEHTLACARMRAIVCKFVIERENIFVSVPVQIVLLFSVRNSYCIFIGHVYIMLLF